MDIQEQYDKIYRYCLRRLGNSALAEDVTQEAFLRFFSEGRYRERGQAIRWLYTVAGHLCADQFRRPPTEPLPEDLPGPELPLEDMALRAALETLSETEQELVVMRYVNQEPVGVIAAHLGMSRFAVYRRTAAALEKLRRALKEDEP